MSSASLYIHIPFCRKKCHYCGFYRVLWDKEKEKRYIAALKQEADFYCSHFNTTKISSVFLGGGTPSCLSEAGLAELLESLRVRFLIDSDSEKTIEMNPESVDEDKLALLKTYGFNRISLGAQSFHQNELETLGRNHSVSHIFQAIDKIRHSGFLNINMDLIFGIPGSDADILLKTIDTVLDINPNHLSFYSLSIEPVSNFARCKVKKISDSKELKQYKLIRNKLITNGYTHYEVSAFAKPGCECSHNLGYWRFKPYIGLGPSAASFFNEKRYKNSSRLSDYLDDPCGRVTKMMTQPAHSKSLLKKEYIIFNLRLLNGFVISEINQMFKCDFETDYADQIHHLTSNGFVELTARRFKVTIKGLYVLDTICECFT
ncbi:radical SAM family heme chaperone HemW [Thermoproteota archaeon]